VNKLSLKKIISLIIFFAVFISAGCVSSQKPSFEPGNIVKELESGDYFLIDSSSIEDYSLFPVSNSGEGKWQKLSDDVKKVSKQEFLSHYSLFSGEANLVIENHQNTKISSEPTKRVEVTPTIIHTSTPTPIPSQALDFISEIRVAVNELNKMHDSAAHGYNARDSDEILKVTADDIWKIDDISVESIDDKTSPIITKKLEYAKEMMDDYLTYMRMWAEAYKDGDKDLMILIKDNVDTAEGKYKIAADQIEDLIQEYYNQ